MKTIKVRFAGFWGGFEPEKLGFFQILQKQYHVVITDDADYLLCSIFDQHPYVMYPQIRIMFSGENYIPDFNLVDYAVSVYPVEFMDRHFSFPGLVDRLDHFYELQNKNRDYPDAILEQKPLFANMIASHNSDNGVRGELFTLLSKYKRIESPGRFMYNMPNGEAVNREDGSKRELQNKCKFTLCCESTCEGGFITEKLFEAFCADTIPVYYGSINVTDIFNKDAFINVADYNSLQDVVNQIVALDHDDEAYLQMLRQPVFAQPMYIEKKLEEFERFLCHIFDQPIEQARRRPQSYMPKSYERIVEYGREKKMKILREEQKKRKREDNYLLFKSRIHELLCIVLGKHKRKNETHK